MGRTQERALGHSPDPCRCYRLGCAESVNLWWSNPSPPPLTSHAHRPFSPKTLLSPTGNPNQFSEAEEVELSVHKEWGHQTVQKLLWSQFFMLRNNYKPHKNDPSPPSMFIRSHLLWASSKKKKKLLTYKHIFLKSCHINFKRCLPVYVGDHTNLWFWPKDHEFVTLTSQLIDKNRGASKTESI